MTYELTIPGPPITKGRPRVSRYGTYTPKKTADFESYVQYCWAAVYGGLNPTDKPLRAELVFYMPIPKSVSKKARAAMEQGQAHIKKPDLDNMAKAVLDALNGLAYADDSQIYDLKVSKRYSDRPRTEVILEETTNV